MFRVAACALTGWVAFGVCERERSQFLTNNSTHRPYANNTARMPTHTARSCVFELIGRYTLFLFVVACLRSAALRWWRWRHPAKESDADSRRRTNPTDTHTAGPQAATTHRVCTPPPFTFSLYVCALLFLFLSILPFGLSRRGHFLVRHSMTAIVRRTQKPMTGKGKQQQRDNRTRRKTRGRGREGEGG